jgi:hypothetical protein
VTKASPEYTDAADLDALAALVNPPPSLQHAVRGTDSLRANGGLLVLINLIEDLAAPLGAADDPLSAQIARIIGEVVPWLFPPWELRACVVPAVRDALADACEFVGALAEGQIQTRKPPHTRSFPHARPHTTRTVQENQHHACAERQDAFTKLVEELRALTAFVCDESQHASRGYSDLPH